MHPKRALPVALLAGVAMAAAAPAAPQSDDPTTAVIIIDDFMVANAREPVAVPDVRPASASSPLEKSAVETMTEVLRYDLRYSGVFDLVADHLVAKVPVGGAERVDYERWVAVGASWLVLVDVSTSPEGKMVVKAWLFETKLDRKAVLAKRFEAGFEVARKVAHRFADLIIAQVGGEPGVSTTQIAFVSDRDSGRDREIFVVDYDGHGARRMTSNRKLNMSPEWSPDNDEIVYTSYIRGNPDLYVIPRLGGANRLLFAEQGINTSPAWSPDGRRIAFASSHRDKFTEIYTILPDGAGIRRLTERRGIDTNPAWSPNGREIAFTSDRSGRPQIWLMEADGLNPRRLTKRGLFNDGAAWSPTGKHTRIAYAGMTSGRFQIFVHTLETDSLVQLTDTGSNEAPSWSPDGRQIAFASTQGGRSDLWVINDDGSNLRRITAGRNNMSPAWSHQGGSR